MKPLLIKLKVYFSVLLGTLIFKGLNLTLRWQRVTFPGGISSPDFYKNPVIFVFWHGRQLMMVPGARPLFDYCNRAPINVLISRHGDGQIVAGVGRAFNLDTVFGSSTRGGVAATKALVDKIAEGSHAAITPDGPRGPIYKFKNGAIKVAQLSGAPLVPLGVAASSYWQFSSWDKMILPKPFSKIVILVGDPIFVPADADQPRLDEINAKIEEVLMMITADAERQANA